MHHLCGIKDYCTVNVCSVVSRNFTVFRRSFIHYLNHTLTLGARKPRQQGRSPQILLPGPCFAAGVLFGFSAPRGGAFLQAQRKGPCAEALLLRALPRSFPQFLETFSCIACSLFPQQTGRLSPARFYGSDIVWPPPLFCLRFLRDRTAAQGVFLEKTASTAPQVTKLSLWPVP